MWQCMINMSLAAKLQYADDLSSLELLRYLDNQCSDSAIYPNTEGKHLFLVGFFTIKCSLQMHLGKKSSCIKIIYYIQKICFVIMVNLRFSNCIFQNNLISQSSRHQAQVHEMDLTLLKSCPGGSLPFCAAASVVHARWSSSLVMASRFCALQPEDLCAMIVQGSSLPGVRLGYNRM